jgi:hypothetical protein
LAISWELLEAEEWIPGKNLTRNPENLHAKLVETNDQYGLSGKVPSVDSIKDMIAQAKGLDPVISH